MPDRRRSALDETSNLPRDYIGPDRSTTILFLCLSQMGTAATQSQIAAIFVNPNDARCTPR